LSPTRYADASCCSHDTVGGRLDPWTRRSAARQDTKDPRSLNHLVAEDGRPVLLALVARHPELGSEVADLVDEVLGRMSSGRVADDMIEAATGKPRGR
jgi:hypothetical protein